MPIDESFKKLCSDFAQTALSKSSEGWDVVRKTFLNEWEPISRGGVSLDTLASTDYLKKVFDDCNPTPPSLLSTVGSMASVAAQFLLKKETLLIGTAALVVSTIAYKMLSKPALKPTLSAPQKSLPPAPIRPTAPPKKASRLSKLFSFNART
jgi:hypothetical protein